MSSEEILSHWLCMVCNEGYAQSVYPAGSEPVMPAGWKSRSVTYSPGSDQYVGRPTTRGVCPECADLTNVEAYLKTDRDDWKFSEDSQPRSIFKSLDARKNLNCAHDDIEELQQTIWCKDCGAIWDVAQMPIAGWHLPKCFSQSGVSPNLLHYENDPSVDHVSTETRSGSGADNRYDSNFVLDSKEKVGSAVGLHQCISSDYPNLSDGGITLCYEKMDGTLWTNDLAYASQVNFCPFCGYHVHGQLK